MRPLAPNHPRPRSTGQALERGLTSLLVGLRWCALAALIVSVTMPSVAAAQRPRVIVLSFEGWHANDARRAVVAGLETSYELIDEDAAVTAAGEIGVDVATPEGMSAVVVHLGIEMVVGGSVTGRNRAARTHIWVSDIHGNELANVESASPSGRGNAAEIGEAARTACLQAYDSLHPPSVPLDDTPPVFTDPDEDYEPDPDDHDDRSADDGDRWVLPIFRGLVGLDIRNRTASIAPNSDASRFDADFFPTIALQFESHPLAFLPGPENGLYVSLAMAFSAGITYTSGVTPFENYDLNTYFAEGNVGYGGVIANMVEIGGTLGAGVDGVGLGQVPTRPPGVPRMASEYPSVEFVYLRLAVFARVRLFQDLVQLEGGLGGRIIITPGQIGANESVWDDGNATGGGFDFTLGLGGVIEPGFSYSARFGFAGHYLSFIDSVRGSESSTDEAFHIHLMVGWAIPASIISN